MTESRALVCPDCKNKKVFVQHDRVDGADYYACKRCHWSVYAEPPAWDVSGRLDVQRLKELNPDKEI